MKTKVVIKQGKEKKILNFYPFIFKDEIQEIRGTYENGDIVELVDKDNSFVALAHINDKAHIPLRVISLADEKIDKKFIKEKIKRAFEKRKHLLNETNSMRIFYSEADGLSGLIVDMFDKYLSVQIRTLGMLKLKDEIIKSLKEVVKPKGIYERSDTDNRADEAISSATSCLYGEIPDRIVMNDNGVLFNVDIINGQKTGFFLDQRDSRNFIKKYIGSSTRFLDVFSSSGGFSMAALKSGAAKVVALDKSPEALVLANENYALNEFKNNFSIVEGDAFAVLKTLAIKKEKYDIIIVDPPALVKKKEDNYRGRDLFMELCDDSFKLLADDGIIGVCTCAYHISLQDLIEVTRMAASKNQKRLEVIGVTYQPSDHPWILHIPESLYLKCLWCRVN